GVAELGQVAGAGAFVPDVQLVVAGGDAAQLEASGGIAHRVPRAGHGEDDRAHLRVDVAEDVREAGAVELARARLAGLVEPEIEGPGIAQREYVVEVRVEVGKGDG